MKYLNGIREKEAVKWLNKSAEIAKKALCFRAKCGAIIVKNGKIIGKGYNAPPLDSEKNRMCNKKLNLGKPKYDKTCCVHAEWRAIIDAIKKNPDKIKGSKLYFIRIDKNGKIKKSGKPYCTVCSRMALDVKINKFILWHEEGICEYPTDEYNKLSYQYQYIHAK